MSVYKLIKWVYDFLPESIRGSQPLIKLKSLFVKITQRQVEVESPKDELQDWFEQIWIPALLEKEDNPVADLRPRRMFSQPQAQKEKILIIVDVPGWAHDLKTDNIIRCLNYIYDIEKVYCDRVEPEQIQTADLIMIYYWLPLFNREQMHKIISALHKNKHKIVMGITSHRQLSGKYYEPGMCVLKELASGIFINNKLLMEEYGDRFDVPVFYTPNGVDTEFFVPEENHELAETLKIGWAGSRSNHGSLRGYDEFIVPAINQCEGVELVTAAREDVWRNQEQMREFYQKLDFYICASSSEGTPNPCLEAMACGIPVLSTPVGNMPDLIEPGVNGFFIKRDIQSITATIGQLRENRLLFNQLRRGARESIKSWDWKVQAINYQNMFKSVLRNNTFKDQAEFYHDAVS